MERNLLTERLKKLKATDRFEILYGPQKKNIEESLGCKILTMPLDQIGTLPREILYMMVTDQSRGSSYLAIFKPIDF